MVRKMLVIDDHPLVVSALQALVGAIDPAVECHGAAGIGEALALLATGPGIDLVLLDLTLDDAVGMQGLEALRATAPELPVVVLSAHDDLQDMVAAVDLGAMGYISKRTGADELARAMGIVMGGGVYIPVAHAPAARGGPAGGEPAVQVPVAAVRDAVPGAGVAVADGGPTLLMATDGGPLAGLTPRQNEVLQLLLRGLSNKLIARELGLSVDTVKDHVAAVLRALGVSSRTQAVLAVSRLGHGLSPAATAAPARAALRPR